MNDLPEWLAAGAEVMWGANLAQVIKVDAAGISIQLPRARGNPRYFIQAGEVRYQIKAKLLRAPPPPKDPGA
jgi:hypothetical protein